MSTEQYFVDGIAVMAPPPDGWVPSIANPARHWDYTTYTLAGIGNSMVLLFMAQRFYLKCGVMKQFELEDGQSFWRLIAHTWSYVKCGRC